jgi:predicted MFS family arabinose efflux permease
VVGRFGAGGGVLPAAHRGKAIGIMQSGWALGYILAALAAAAIPPHYGWRILFAPDAGAGHGVIRRRCPSPSCGRISKNACGRPARFGTLAATAHSGHARDRDLVASSVLFAYWGLFTWIPTFLSTPIEKGGAGLGIVRSSAWVIPMQIGAFFGYTTFGFGADRFGRRPMFIGFLLAAAVIVPVYSMLGRNELALLLVDRWWGSSATGTSASSDPCSRNSSRRPSAPPHRASRTTAGAR